MCTYQVSGTHLSTHPLYESHFVRKHNYKTSCHIITKAGQVNEFFFNSVKLS